MKSDSAKNEQGFTLIEILVVIVIMGILAALVVPKVLSRPDEARIVAARQDIATLTQAIKLFKLDNRRYPTQEEGLRVLVTGKPGIKGTLERLPTDPWGNAYQYLIPGQRQDFDVFSYGADGAAGGEGSNADIGNWETDTAKP